MSLQVTVDKNDTVIKVERPAGESRWRFKRTLPFTQTSNRKLTEAQEQEIIALYVDHPELRVRKIAEMFGITAGGLSVLIRNYDIPLRRPGVVTHPQHPAEVGRDMEAAMQRVGDETLREVVKDQAADLQLLRQQVADFNRQIQERDDQAENNYDRIVIILERLSTVMNSVVDEISERDPMEHNLTTGDVLIGLGKMRGLLEWAIAEIER